MVDAIYNSVCEIALAKPAEIQEIPEEAEEEDKDKIKEANEAAQKLNAQIEVNQKKICLRRGRADRYSKRTYVV